MPTPAEKKALLFLASVILLGASVRALRAVGTIEKVPTGNIHALDGQLAAVDSARRVKHGGAKGRTLRGRVTKTLVRGKVVYDGSDVVGSCGQGEFIPPVV